MNKEPNTILYEGQVIEVLSDNKFKVLLKNMKK